MAKDSSYLERLRCSRMPSGKCPLCGNWLKHLIKHREKLTPLRTILICMDCRNKVQYEPGELSDEQKEKLLCARHGPAYWNRMARHPKLKARLLKNYAAPGTRIPRTRPLKK